ncbi:hypothetical protein R8871_04789 [Paraburkholderia graminis C4D1M]|jgi:hypothetical protein|uniref:Uncharacterized protein n=1 Tax=Paraburkholderia graminis (strain ATCC 700544 / DSM 17151 / LMG 18924 / NCIMB 13744 / C4D1M) TaxID=396598 RepID=B1G9V0_PARG4|nr:hypothetical protein [Paraburkholderia graminis]EDT07098.1 hypothetical protein BgramDRAFT_6120 [Paraburkholderia graminis C4D1M]CAB3720207.1 hypothetical protein R8871_04789 [Paraburkholderia graminis C4D1M]
MTSTNRASSVSTAIEKNTAFNSDGSKAGPRNIAYLVYQGFQMQDLAGPLAVFDEASREAALSQDRSLRPFKNCRESKTGEFGGFCDNPLRSCLKRAVVHCFPRFRRGEF